LSLLVKPNSSMLQFRPVEVALLRVNFSFATLLSISI
jgi:hypothetical protein